MIRKKRSSTMRVRNLLQSMQRKIHADNQRHGNYQQSFELSELITDDRDQEMRERRQKEEKAEFIHELAKQFDENIGPTELEEELQNDAKYEELQNLYEGKNDQQRNEIMISQLRKEFQKDYLEEAKNLKLIPVIHLVLKNDIQIVESYSDNYPYLNQRKQIMLFKAKISHAALLIIKSPVFEGTIMMIIIWNSVMLALDDPTTDYEPFYISVMNEIFLAAYSLEMILKVTAKGFIFKRGSYLWDLWNILDFALIVTAYIPYFTGNAGSNITSLRALRVLRPLRTISSIKALRDILSALISATGLLQNVLVILIFFYAIFAIAGLQLFMGLLKKRCFSEGEGIGVAQYCSASSECASGFICGKMLTDPVNGLMNFNTFGWAFLQVFVITTLEGWTDIMNATILCSTSWAVFYFLIVVFIGAFFLVNLTLAIIKVKFSQAQQGQKVVEDPPPTSWAYRRLLEAGLYKRQLKRIDPMLISCFQKHDPSPNKNFLSPNISKILVSKQIAKNKLKAARIKKEDEELPRSPIETPDNHTQFLVKPQVNYFKRDVQKFGQPALLTYGTHRIKLNGIQSFQQNENTSPKTEQKISTHFPVPQTNENPIIDELEEVDNLYQKKKDPDHQSLRQLVQAINMGKVIQQKKVPLNVLRQVDQQTAKKLRKLQSRSERKNSIVASSVSSPQSNLIGISPKKSSSPYSPNQRFFKGTSAFASPKNQISDYQADESPFIISEQPDSEGTIPSQTLEENLYDLGLNTEYFRRKKLIRPTTPKKKQSIMKRSEVRIIDEKYLKPKEKPEEVDLELQQIREQVYMQQLHLDIIKEPQKVRDFSSYSCVLPQKETHNIIKNLPLEKKILLYTFQNGQMQISLKKRFKKMKSFLVFNQNKKSKKLENLRGRSILEQPDMVQEKLMKQRKSQNGLQSQIRNTTEEEQDLIRLQMDECASRKKQRHPAEEESPMTYNDYILGFNQKEEDDPDQIDFMKQRQKFVLDIPRNEELKKNPHKLKILTQFEAEMYDCKFYYQYQNICRKDKSIDDKIIFGETSIQDVMVVPVYSFFEQDFIRNYNSLLRALNFSENETYIWLAGFTGFLKLCKRHLFYFVNSRFLVITLNIAVFINIVLLAMDGLLPSSTDDTLGNLNLLFTMLFTADMTLKLIAYGITDYLRDSMNSLDAIIVTLSLIEVLVFGKGGNTFSAFRSVRIFRAFRVLRVTKLMRTLQFMNFIVKVVSNALQSFIYIFLLLILFLYIFTLLGMQLFGGAIGQSIMPIRQNFDTFMAAFMVTFQVLTLENWSSLLYSLLLSPVPSYETFMYLVLWIFIGNYVFLNLFLAILLDRFEEEWMKNKEIIADDDFAIAKDTNLIADVTNFKKTQHFASQSQAKSSQKKIISLTNEVYKDPKNEFIYFKEKDMCEYSFYFFSQGNVIRRFCYRAVNHTQFEYIVLIAIFGSSIQLVLLTYIGRSSELYYINQIFDYIFLTLFMVEAIMKMIAFGFVLTPHSYLRDGWSLLDFFIVMTSLLDACVDQINLKFFKVLRLLRTLRPLRFISHNRNLKLVVAALLQSAGGLFNVFVMVLLSWIIFAILGINLMKGKSHYCSIGGYYHEQECLSLGGSWNNRDINFDNIYNGLITLFVLSTLEGWPDYMYNFIDVDETGPIKNSQTAFFWYFFVFILVGSMFLLNLFIGVILVNYHLAEELAKDCFLTQDQANWVEIQKLILGSNPDFGSYYPPENKFRAMIFNFIKNKYFEPSIMLCILANVISMAFQTDGMSNNVNETLNTINLVFTTVFISEAILKLIAYHPQIYFKSGWNKYDFVVVATSIVDIMLDYLQQDFKKFLRFGPQLVRVFRILRVSRLFRLVKQFQGLQKLIETTIYSLPAVLNVIALVFLVFFIFAIMASYLFQDIRSGDIISDIMNFSDFHHSILLLFRCATGENWYQVMFDTTRSSGSYVNVLFFVFFIVITQFIMLNLFILIMLEQYEQFYINEDNPLNHFADLELTFVESWCRYTAESKGQKMLDRNLVDLLLEMDLPLGISLKNKLKTYMKNWKDQHLNVEQTKEVLENIKQQYRSFLKVDASKQIMQMNIYSDPEGYVYYHQILFAFMKNSILNKLLKDITPEGAELLQKHEEKTLKSLKSQLMNKHGDQNFGTVNPVVQHLFAQIAFKTLRRNSEKKKKNQTKVIDKQNNHEFSEKNSSDSSFDPEFHVISRDHSSNSSQSDDEFKYPLHGIPDTNIYQDEGFISEHHDCFVQEHSSNESSNKSLQEIQDLQSEESKESDENPDVKKKLKSDHSFAEEVNKKQIEQITKFYQPRKSQKESSGPIINVSIQNNFIINQNYYYFDQAKVETPQPQMSYVNLIVRGSENILPEQ